MLFQKERLSLLENKMLKVLYYSNTNIYLCAMINKRKVGRPKGEPTTIITFRVKKKLAKVLRKKINKFIKDEGTE